MIPLFTQEEKLTPVLNNTLQVVLPAIAEAVFVGLVGMVDTMMVGGLGPAAIAAVGLTAQPKFIGLSIFISLNSAVASVVARRYGERDKKDANNVLLNGLLLTLFLTLITSFLFVKYGYEIVSLMQGDEETTALASDYIKIIMGGMVFTTVTLFINSCQRGTGNTKITFRTNLVSNIINVIFNYLLIGGKMGFPRLEVKGAAIATVIGSFVGFLMAVSSVLPHHGFLSLFANAGIGMKKNTTASLIKIGSSTLAEQICMRIGFLLFAITVSSLGTYCFAANQIGMNMAMISFSIGDGLSAGALALVGRSMGENNLKLAKQYIKCCLNIGRTASVFTTIIFFGYGKQLFLMFSQDSRVIEYAVFISAILGVVTLFQIPAMTFAGSLRGAGDAAFIALMSLISIAFVRPLSGWFFTYPMGWGLRGAWLGFLIDQSLRFFLNYGRFKTGKWEKIKI